MCAVEQCCRLRLIEGFLGLAPFLGFVGCKSLVRSLFDTLLVGFALLVGLLNTAKLQP